MPVEAPHIDLKKQILGTLLENPFLDDDLQGLALRLDTPSGPLTEALDGLCQAQMLKAAGKRGYILDAARLTQTASGVAPTGPNAVSLPNAELPPMLVHLFDRFPGGVLLLAADGRQLVANEEMALLLEVPRADLDGQAFTCRTGIALDEVSLEPEIRQVLDYPPGLEIVVRSCPVAEEAKPAGVFIVARQTEPMADTMQAQALFQEELFEGLRAHLVNPLMRIEQFLENPDASGLAKARAALERVNWFLGDLFLAQKNGMVRLDQEQPGEE